MSFSNVNGREIEFSGVFPCHTVSATNHDSNYSDSFGNSNDITEESNSESLNESTEFACPCSNGLNIDAGTGMTPAQVGLPQSWFSPDPNAPAPPDCISITGRLVIPYGWIQNFSGVQTIYMNPGSEIHVESGGRLRFFRNEVVGCEKMWRGITVAGGGEIALIGTPEEPTIIADAQYAVTFEPQASLYQCNNVVFRNNHIGLYNDPNNAGYIHNYNPISGVTFLSAGPLLDSFDDIDYYSNKAGFAGIYLTDAFYFNFGHSSISANPNRFEGLRNGIITDGCFFQVWHAIFEDLEGEANILETTLDNSTAIGIRATNNVHTLVQQCQFNGTDDKGIENIGSSLDVYYNNQFNTKINIFSRNPEKLKVDLENIFHYGQYGILSLDGGESYQGITAGNHFTNFNDGVIEWSTAIFMSSFASKETKEILNNNDYLNQNGANGAENNGIGGFDLNGSQPIYISGGAHINIGVNDIICNNFLNSIRADNTTVTRIFRNRIEGLSNKGHNHISLKNVQGSVCSNSFEAPDAIDLGTGIKWSYSNRVDIRHNTFSPKLEYALYGAGSTAVLGRQQNQSGNDWGGNTLFHFGNEITLENSAFYEANPPYSQIVTPNGMPSQWFYTSFEPPAIEPCAGFMERSKLTTEQLKTISGFYADQEVKSWETKREVYRLMAEHPEWQGNQPIADQFYNENTTTSIGKLYLVDRALDDLFDIPDAIQAQMDAYRNELAAYGEEYSALSLSISEANTEAEADEIREKLRLLVEGLLPKAQWLRDTYTQLKEQRQLNVDAVLALNAEVQDAFLLERNEKTVNDVYLLTEIKGQVMTDSQYKKIWEIANLCPEVGGKSVFKARALLHFQGDLSLFDDDALCGWEKPEEIVEETLTSSKVFSIQPNPTNAYINVHWPMEQQSDEMIRADILKPMGTVLRSFEFSGQSGYKMLDLDIQPGIYTVNFYRDGQFVEYQTIVITE